MSEHEAVQRIEIAVSKMKTFLEQMFARHQDDINLLKNDVVVLKEHDEAFQKQVHESCDIMNQTVDSKIEKALVKHDGILSKRLDVMEKVYDGRIKLILWGMAFMFGGWSGTIAYFNNADGLLHEKNNRNKEHLVENGTNIKHIQNMITKAIDDGYYLTKGK